MMMQDYDKENFCESRRNVYNNSISDLKGKSGVEKSFQKKSDLASTKKIASRFGQLLTDATNEIRVEEDTIYAIDQQAEEAVTVLSEWLQESQDFQLAQDLAKALEQEQDCQKRLELIQGEAEALRVAVEEKRRIKSEAQAKADREREDEEFARKLAADEVKYFEDRKQQFEDDEKMSYQLEQEEKRLYSDSKSESKDFDGDDCADAKSSRFEHKEDRPMKEEVDEKEAPKEVKEKTKRELRSEEQRRLFKELPSNHPYKKFNFKVMKDETVISKIWEKAAVEVQEIKDSLCIVLQLPNIQKLHIGIENQGKQMKIEAKRLVRKSSSTASLTNIFSSDSTNYNAEFVLDGDINVTSQDIYHEYNAEYGLLYIYVENICLDKDFAAKDGMMLEKGKQLLNSFKDKFLRIFGK